MVRVSADGPVTDRADLLAIEEPLEIRVGGTALTVTMRTPGDDIDLAAGFLFGEGIAREAADIAEIRMCDENVADVTLAVDQPPAASAGDGGRGVSAPRSNGHRAVDAAPEAGPGPAGHRNFLMTSACGVCGKDSIDAIRVTSRYDIAADPVRVAPAVLADLPDKLRDAQRVFASTGGLHAAGLFTAEGELLALREDVGRHNAVDKVVGWALRAGRIPLRQHVLLVSGRASFELAQKAVTAGVPVLAAVSAPSSLAVDLAGETGLTLVGFLRGPSMNAYTRTERLSAEPAYARESA